MAKKVVASLQSGEGKTFTKCIKMVRSPKSGAYTFEEEIVHNEHIKDFFSR
jgi:ABC-type histidine transport system ATPase subunit